MLSPGPDEVGMLDLPRRTGATRKTRGEAAPPCAVSPLEPLYFLLEARPTRNGERWARIEAWERQHELSLPAALVEYFSTDVTLQLIDGSPWTLSLEQLWREYSTYDEPEPLDRVLDAVTTSSRPDGALIRLLSEHEGRFHLYLSLDPTERASYDDPPVWVDEPEHCHLLTDARSLDGERGARVSERFSELLFFWIQRFYALPFTPLRFAADPAACPPKRYVDGVWRCSELEAIAGPVLDALLERFPHEVTTERRASGPLRSYRFELPDATLRLVADARDEGARGVWFAHGRSPAALSAAESALQRLLGGYNPRLRGFRNALAVDIGVEPRLW